MIALIPGCLSLNVSLQASTNPRVREGYAAALAVAERGDMGRRARVCVRRVNSCGVCRNYKITEQKAAATK